MAIRVTRVSSGESFDYGPDVVDARSRDLTDLLYLHTSRTLKPGRELVECRMHDPLPEFASRVCRGRHCDRGSSCERVHGILVKLVKLDVETPDEQWIVAHYDKSDSHDAGTAESDVHKLLVEHWCIAGVAGGHSADSNVKLRPSDKRSPVADALITGPAGRFDIEPQLYHQTIPGIKGRVTNLRKYGVEPVFNPERATPWSEQYVVPHVRTNDLREALGVDAPQRSWKAISGLRHAPETEWCHISNGTICPVRGSGKWCGKRHPKLEAFHPTVYEVAERLPAGDIVTVTHARNGAQYLMPAADRDLCLDHGGILLGAAPGGAARMSPADIEPDSIAQRGAVDNWRPREGFGAVLDARLDSGDRSAWPVFRRGPSAIYLCQRCGSATLAMADGLCMRCRAALRMDMRPR